VLRVAIVGIALLLASAGAVSAQGSEAEQARARQKIFMMEGVLERAVALGIDSFRRQLSAVMPDDMLLISGDGPQARGFRLDGYGVFFDVEVPGVRPSLAWSLRTMNETAALFTRDLAQLRRQLAQTVSDPGQRAEMDRVLARIQAQVAPGPQSAPAPRDVRAAGAPQVTAQTQAQTQAFETSQPAPAPAPMPPAAATLDPGELFTNSVAAALVDAMLENSGSLVIAPGEWLTVAARDNAQGNRFVASDPSDVTTVVLRVKGSDLADFQARRLTAEEVRKRVEVRSF
jgi:hypothetical protein